MERFWSKVDVRGPDECWLWLASTTRNGYGQFRDGKMHKAHRYAWELANGRPVAEGLTVHHTCEVKACVNPSHLVEMSYRDNIMASDTVARRNAEKTECGICGGPFKLRNGRRVCPRCERERAAEWRKANPEKWREAMRKHDRKRRPRITPS